MAISSCGKCGNTFFEIKEFEPMGGVFKANFVQCAKCGVVVGVQEFFNNGTILKAQSQMLNLIAEKLGIPDRLDTR